MEQRILIFFACVYVLIWLLALFPRSMASRIAFSWVDPEPQHGESWARYQLRWAFYSLDWLAQILILLLVLSGVTYFHPAIQDNGWYIALAAFALPLGAALRCAALALLAASGFSIKALKAWYFGPNPKSPFSTIGESPGA